LRLVLMGPPGAGKGTQAKRLVEKFGMAHLSSGDLFRAEKASGSELGRKLASYMDAGKLVPDEIVVELMAKAITHCRAPGGLLLDGFPRTLRQAKALDEQLAKAGRPLDAVVVVTADPEQIVERISGRRSCPRCGKVYHLTHLPPRRDAVCDVDGTALVQRDDDKEEVVRQRLATYRRQTEPVVEYYRQRGARIAQADGNAAPDEVTAALAKALDGFSQRA